MPKTIGLSPKAWVPAIAGLLVGAALLAAGYITHDPTIESVGYAVVAAGLGHFGLAIAAPPGLVIPADVKTAAAGYFAKPSVTTAETAVADAGKDIAAGETQPPAPAAPAAAPPQDTPMGSTAAQPPAPSPPGAA